MKIKLPNATRSSINKAIDDPDLSDSIYQLDVSHSFDISSGRSGSDSIAPVNVEDDDILEITLNDGSRWFLSAEEREELKSRQELRSRGSSDDFLTIGDSLFPDQSSRGLSDFLLKKIRIFKLKSLSGFSVKEVAADLLKDVSPAQALLAAADPAAFAIARKLERTLETKGESKLCRLVSDDKDQYHLNTTGSVSDAFSDEGPTLILLHGTLSSTQGSFSGLWQHNPRSFKKLLDLYEGRILALEHCTLTESPIDNAKTIVDELPDSVHIHLLSHSRGGLIGELLCRAERDVVPFDDVELEMYQELLSVQSNPTDLGVKAVEAIKKFRGIEHAKLKELGETLKQKSIRVEKFVRVACPARGTTLASGRLHRWANRSLNAIGLITGMKTSMTYRAFETFTLGILKSTSKPVVLPGLHSMMPDGALVHLLNDSFIETNESSTDGKSNRKLMHSDLSVVAGDTEIEGFNWKRVPLWLTDQFFGGEHDLVVNFASTDGGGQRANGINVYETVGKNVNHFSYFKNSDTAIQITRQLLSSDDSEFKLSSQREDVNIARGRKISNTGDRPMLFVVPGISGSKLSAQGDRIWLNPFRIAFGGMSRLAINEEDITANDVFNLAYGKFMEKFNHDHDVYSSPYDWRLSLSDAAANLADQIKKELKDRPQGTERQALRIVGHSMGGLVVRHMLVNNNDIWEYLLTVPGSRFIMAGTPNNGSYSINNLLIGKDGLARKIAKLDLRNDIDDIVELLSEFPGVATLLPGFGTHDWMQADSWNEFKKDEVKTKSGIPSKSLLNIAREERRTVLASPLDSKVVSYVAGHAPRTEKDADFEGNDSHKELVYKYTPNGDGRVTWADGIPSGLNTVWYQNTVHGALLADEKHFKAWQELLHTGKTDLLSQIPPDPIYDKESGNRRSVGSSSLDQEFNGDTADLDYLPSEESLEKLLLDLESPVVEEGSKSTRITVRVSHGDLSYSAYPTVVGHYKDDSIAHAESALDQFLDFRLSERQRLGQYPGDLATSEVVFRQGEGNVPEGALVIGLGEFGELSIPRLERSLTNGIIKYILTYNEWWLAKSDSNDANNEVGLSFLLVGSGQGGLSIEESIRVIIRSVRNANEQFEPTDNDQRFRLIKHIEVVELYRDLAVEAAHAALYCKSAFDQITVAKELVEIPGGLRRMNVQSNPEWWQTWAVRKREHEAVYEFENFTKTARTRLIDEPVNAMLVNQFLTLIMDRTDFDPSAELSPYKTLFEILIPNAIKATSPDTDKLKLKLDKETARIPWEMMIDGWSSDNKPLAVTKKLVRQLALKEGIPLELARGNQALVVGDPPSGDEWYSLLEGARKEAVMVAKLLTDEHHFNVTKIIRESDDLDQETQMGIEILNALTTGEFKILHLAGHGSYYRGGIESEEEAQDEGMIIGKNMRLTPTLVNKMRRIPQVVFINCCHLGNIEDRDRTIRHPDIAANLATQFIQKGAKAVIAAAWEVLDQPAMMFAEVFYKNLLDNKTLSDSIHAARCEVYEEFSDSNTFGAYQCWGDPMYRLNPVKRARASGKGKVRYVSPEECIDAAHNIRMRAKATLAGSGENLVSRCDDLFEFVTNNYVDLAVPEPVANNNTDKTEWSSAKTRVLTQLGRAYGELREFPKAIYLLRAALVLDPDNVLAEEIEQLGNFECRLAANAYVARKLLGDPQELEPLSDSENELITEGTDRLENLLHRKLADKSVTVSRELLGMLGSAMKRKATMQRKVTSEIRNTLLQMSNYYGTGWSGDLSLKPSASLADYLRAANARNIAADNYAFTNMTLSFIVLQWFENKKSPKSNKQQFSNDFIHVFRIFTRDAANKQERPKDFWEITEFAILLILQILDDSLRSRVGLYGDHEELVIQFEQCCNNAIARPGSKREWASVYDDLYFIEEMLRKRTSAPDQVNENMIRIRQIADGVFEKRAI